MAHTLKTFVLPGLVIAGIGAFLYLAPPDPLVSEPPRARVPDAKYADAASCLPRDTSKTAPVSLASLKQALDSRAPLRVLAIGPASYEDGPFASQASYPDLLATYLGKVFKGEEIELVSRNIAGEVAEDAAARLRQEVAEAEPDLVVWQVGSADALARVDRVEFEAAFLETLDWLAEHDIDVVLVDPRYVPELADDPAYRKLVGAVWYYAKKRQIPLVRRYDMMRTLALPADSAESPPEHRSTGFDARCMAEKVAETIVVGSRAADTDRTRPSAPGSERPAP